MAYNARRRMTERIIGIGILLTFLGMWCVMFVYDNSFDKPVSECGIVKEVGGCMRYKGCMVRLEDGSVRTVNTLAIAGEEVCWVVGREKE